MHADHWISQLKHLEEEEAPVLQQISFPSSLVPNNQSVVFQWQNIYLPFALQNTKYLCSINNDIFLCKVYVEFVWTQASTLPVRIHLWPLEYLSSNVRWLYCFVLFYFSQLSMYQMHLKLWFELFISCIVNEELLLSAFNQILPERKPPSLSLYMVVEFVRQFLSCKECRYVAKHRHKYACVFIGTALWLSYYVHCKTIFNVISPLNIMFVFSFLH